MNLATWILLAAMILAACWIVRKMIRDTQSGKSCCGSGCNHCSGCDAFKE